MLGGLRNSFAKRSTLVYGITDKVIVTFWQGGATSMVVMLSKSFFISANHMSEGGEHTNMILFTLLIILAAPIVRLSAGFRKQKCCWGINVNASRRTDSSTLKCLHRTPAQLLTSHTLFQTTHHFTRGTERRSRKHCVLTIVIP